MTHVRFMCGHLLLVAVAEIGVILLAGSILAGLLAAICVVLGSAWTTLRYQS